MVAFQNIKDITNLVKKTKWGNSVTYHVLSTLTLKQMNRKGMLTKKKGWHKTVKSVRKAKTQSEFSETLKEPAN